jgi:hypothetical protein
MAWSIKLFLLITYHQYTESKKDDIGHEMTPKVITAVPQQIGLELVPHKKTG